MRAAAERAYQQRFIAGYIEDMVQRACAATLLQRRTPKCRLSSFLFHAGRCHASRPPDTRRPSTPAHAVTFPAVTTTQPGRHAAGSIEDMLQHSAATLLIYATYAFRRRGGNGCHAAVRHGADSKGSNRGSRRDAFAFARHVCSGCRHSAARVFRSALSPPPPPRLLSGRRTSKENAAAGEGRQCWEGTAHSWGFHSRPAGTIWSQA